MKSEDTFDLGHFKIPLIMMSIFWVTAVVLWRTTGRIFYLYNFVYIGTALGVGIGIYSALPKRQKLWGRRWAQFLVGAYMLVFLGLFQRENMQIEGFFFYLLSGFFAGSVIHYLVAKVAGPIVFNRGWCGWACWTAMVLDLLPYRPMVRLFLDQNLNLTTTYCVGATISTQDEWRKYLSMLSQDSIFQHRPQDVV